MRSQAPRTARIEKATPASARRFVHFFTERKIRFPRVSAVFFGWARSSISFFCGTSGLTPGAEELIRGLEEESDTARPAYPGPARTDSMGRDAARHPPRFLAEDASWGLVRLSHELPACFPRAFASMT